MKKPLKIVLASGENVRKKTERFIKKEYRRHFGTEPSSPKTLFAAIQEHKIVGSLAISTSQSESDPLPIEKISDISYEDVPLSITRLNAIQFSRWAGTVPYAALALLYTACIYARKQNRMFGWAELKPFVSRYLEGLNVLLYPVPTVFDIEKIEKKDRPYYTTPPLPSVYVLDLAQAQNITGEVICPLVRKNDIILDRSIIS